MPSDFTTIEQFLTSDAWTDGEKFIIRWQFNQGFGGTLLGEFDAALIKAICLADDLNLLRLEFAFPMEVQGYLAWTRSDLGRRLRAAGLCI